MKKQIKKLTALALSLLLSLSLALPALAYEDTDPPLWKDLGFDSLEQLMEEGWMTREEYYQSAAEAAARQKAAQAWLEAHPEQVAAFDLLAYFDREYFYYDSPQEYMETFGLDEEAFRRRILIEWAGGEVAAEQAQRELGDFIAAHPDEYAAFDLDAYFEQEYFYYDSPQEYMDSYGLTQEEFRQEMLYAWMATGIEMEDYRAQLRQEKLDAGGSPEGVNVMVNGRCVPFSGVRPELRQDRTMIPLAQVMAHLGAQVSYESDTHTAVITLDGRTLRHQVDSDAITVTDEHGRVSSITMDVPSYTRDGQTMVPLAFFAQALGYTAAWDGEYETAVLVSPQALAKEIDGQFTLFNRLLYALFVRQVPQEQPLQQTGQARLDLTLLDSLNGDRRYSMTLGGDSLATQSTLNAAVTADLGALADWMEQQGIYDTDREELARLRDLLSDFSLEVIADRESSAVYLRSPLLPKLIGALSGDVWVSLPGEDLPLPSQAPTVGAVLSQAAVSSYWMDFGTWRQAIQEADFLALFVGDGRFTRSGSSYILNWNKDSLLRQFGAATEDLSYYYGLSQLEGMSFDLNLKLTPAGEGCSFTLTMDMSTRDLTADLDLSGDAGRTDLTANFHIKNTVKGSLTVKVRVSPTTRQPKTRPGEGESVISPTNYLGTGSVA